MLLATLARRLEGRTLVGRGDDPCFGGCQMQTMYVTSVAGVYMIFVDVILYFLNDVSRYEASR